jgi:quinoprotein glucose dehydrogenase
VAVNVRTGDYVWHFQTIHHDLWDADPPAPPVLYDIPSEGGAVPALGVTTKSGYLYILNRETGEPIFGVEERPVPASDVPGELAFATQPIPVVPAPMARVSWAPADLVTADDTSPEHAAACQELLAGIGEVYNAGPFTPWAYRAEGVPERTTLLFPGLVGGPNWGGVAHDPASGLLFVFSQDLGSFGWVEAADADYPVPYNRSGPRPATFDVAMGDQRWPCQKPPWGQLTAVDGSTGDIAWQRPLGLTEGLPPDRQNTGRQGRAAAIVTAGGLLFIASTDDDRFRALDLTTGDELWSIRLSNRGNANPMTYSGPDGRQYVAIAATDRIFAYALP